MKTMNVVGVLSVLFLAAVAAWSQAPAPATQPAAARPDIVLADFEGMDYGDWKVTGEAFGPGPRQGDSSVWPFQGNRFAWSMNKGDASVGTLTSPEFKIDRRYITFLISGGNHPGETCINLLVDGKVARTATGADHEWMVRCLWDVGEFSGKAAKVEIVDKHTGNWGHINIDDIVMTDEQRLSPWTFFEAKDAACTRLPLYVCVRPDPNDKHWPDDKTKLQLAINAQWKITGELFGPEVGRMISPDFKIDHRYLNLYCSPVFNEMTVLTLRVEGQVVAAGGYGPTGSDGWRCWDVSACAGKTGRFEIIDRHSVNLPQIQRLAVFLGDEKLPCCLLVAQYTDLKKIESRLPDQPIKYVPGSDEVMKDDLGSDYTEKYRPQFHFTCNHGHMNDPNGLLYYEGEYHLFMQHAGGWGHAVSKDLVHWVQLQQALFPDNVGAAWSGSAVVDSNNTSGFQTGKDRPLVAVYASGKIIALNPTETIFRQVQSIAYSNDRGRTWTKYEGNPAIPQQDRDPKMFWYEPDKSWRLVLYQCPPGRAHFASKDLKHWTKVGGHWFGTECPDFFELPVAGEPNVTQWIAVGGDGKYLVGDFDGKEYKSGDYTTLLRVEYGGNFYATQTFNDIPKSDGRRIQITWMNGGDPYPGTPTSGQQMTFPCELTLRRCPEGLRMFSNPVREIEKLRRNEHTWKDLSLAPGENPLAQLAGDLFDVRVEIDPLDATEVGLRVRGEEIRYVVKDAKLLCRKSGDGRTGEAPVELQNHRLKLQVLVDRVSLETFAQDGKATLSVKFMPRDDAKPLELYALGGKAKVVSMTVYELNSAWTQPPRKDRSHAQGGFIKLGAFAALDVDIDKLTKEIQDGKIGEQNWRLADDSTANWCKNDPQDSLCEADQTALPKMPGTKFYYVLQTDISSAIEQDVMVEGKGDILLFHLPNGPALDRRQEKNERVTPMRPEEKLNVPFSLRAGLNRLVLLCGADGPVTVRVLKPGTENRADVEFLPPAIDDKAAPYTPPSGRPLTRKTLAGKWRAKITLKLPPAPSMDQPNPDHGLTELARKSVATDADDRDWEVVPVPSPNAEYSSQWSNINGESVFRKSVNIPPQWAGKDLTLSLGAIDDFDDTFFNGVFVGRIDKNTDRFFAVPRVYRVPGKLVKAGANVIAVRAFDHYGGGGMLGPEADLFIEPAP